MVIKWMIIFIILLVLVVIFLYRLGNHSDHRDSDRYLYNLNNDASYRKGVYRQINASFRPYIENLYKNIDRLLEKAKNLDNEANQTQYNYMVNILNKANDLEAQIRSYWNSSKFNKDFAYYIGLHYASHLLAGAIKTEQQRIKSTFVSCKNRQDLWSKKIDVAKRQQERLHGKQRSKLSAEIGEMCKVHKNISILKGRIGAINTQYNNRVTQQNIETAKRRDFIGANFGLRGKKWRDKIMAKHSKA
ncbi:hypothetical protein D1841_07515 [Neglecta sp. X4]|uniref:hypothetical protein n=1 Tax=unclassified Neglectibacter TaxID=2632164 RepID=UPI0013718257|nr:MULTISPECIES: hypothetical protein [unclassified Neglectibacter]NBI17553.1 hypothetical protein [Neglectibacter sp. 59]NBJ73157.1 hypothetical protein [Neglectibacter sp. X4]